MNRFRYEYYLTRCRMYVRSDDSEIEIVIFSAAALFSLSMNLQTSIVEVYSNLSSIIRQVSSYELSERLRQLSKFTSRAEIFNATMKCIEIYQNKFKQNDSYTNELKMLL